MCLASVYVEHNGEKQLAMAKTVSVENTPEGIVCRDFLGRVLTVTGSVRKIDLENNVIVCDGISQS